MEKYQEYIQKLERELKYRNYSTKTIKAYCTCIKIFLEYLDSEISSEFQLKNIKRDQIIDFLLYLQSKNKAPKTVNLYKESIKFFL